MYSNSPLTDTNLMAVAPSIFAAQPYSGMSSRYAFIPTIDIVRAMRGEGFEVFDARQAKARTPDRREYTKHALRFRNVSATGSIPTLGGILPELVLINSHDGASAYKLLGGLFRLVCTNGLVVCDATLGKQISVRHTGNPDGVIEASYEVVNEFPRVLDQVETFSGKLLTEPQQTAFAEAALHLKYGDEPAPIRPEQIIRPRRAEDREPTLWNTMNTAQEHLIQGGVRGRNAETRRRVTTRPVTGISEDTKLNQALWMLTEKMAELLA